MLILAFDRAVLHGNMLRFPSQYVQLKNTTLYQKGFRFLEKLLSSQYHIKTCRSLKPFLGGQFEPLFRFQV